MHTSRSNRYRIKKVKDSEQLNLTVVIQQKKKMKELQNLRIFVAFR